MWEHRGFLESFQQDANTRFYCIECIDFGYVKCGQAHKALALVQEMQWKGVEPSVVTVVGVVVVLNACANVLALGEGKYVHEHKIWSGLESNSFVGNSLEDMYVKCKILKETWKVFNKMPTCNAVSWSVQIFLRCTKILSHCHPFLSFLPRFFYHVKSHL
jgi:pentatricopeptide repeat protein